LLRSLRVDRVLILQYRRATSQQCRVFAAQMQLEFCRQHLEQLYRSSRDHWQPVQEPVWSVRHSAGL